MSAFHVSTTRCGKQSGREVHLSSILSHEQELCSAGQDKIGSISTIAQSKRSDAYQSSGYNPLEKQLEIPQTLGPGGRRAAAGPAWAAAEPCQRMAMV